MHTDTIMDPHTSRGKATTRFNECCRCGLPKRTPRPTRPPTLSSSPSPSASPDFDMWNQIDAIAVVVTFAYLALHRICIQRVCIDRG